ncbi:unnamed protein product [Phytophthora fragariaefolia]|uniref:Unnamed protein product n=1 Tax=Phytophthora fragariaefolia TaxID=1490495 RepID=A0A9W6X084_9STRA|nr:unnamed protein product [Phytophthora fragariaefolia]
MARNTQLTHEDARGENGERQRRSETDGVLHQIHGWRRVDRGHPHETAPAEIVARAVVHDVDAAHVAGLPPKELGHVHELQRHAHGHGVAEEAVELALLAGVREHAHGPEHEAAAAVGEELDVPAQHARVQLRAPVEVEDGVARRAGVTGRLPQEGALDVQEEAEDEAEDVERRDDLGHVVVDDAARVELEHEGAGQEQRQTQREALEAVARVLGHVAAGRHGTERRFAGHRAHEHELRGHEAADELPGRGVPWRRPDLEQRVACREEGADRAAVLHEHVRDERGGHGRGRHEEERAQRLAAREEPERLAVLVRPHAVAETLKRQSRTRSGARVVIRSGARAVIRSGCCVITAESADAVYRSEADQFIGNTGTIVADGVAVA